MKTSDLITMRLQEANARFNANDNISEFIKDGELEAIQIEVENAMQEVLKALVIDIDNDHNTQETAKRVAKMFIQETLSGRYKSVPKITAFPNMGYDGLYTTGPISIRSVCAHHFQNIVGKCWVGIIPEEKVIGLSKFNRIVHHIAERPQIQEEMTTQVANALQDHAQTENVAVVIQAEHHCMTARGVKEHESNMCTSVLLGAFRKDFALRTEFYKTLELANMPS